MEYFSIVFSFSEHCDPGESCLSSLKCEEFEQFTIVMDRNSPLIIMVIDVELVGGTAPGATSYIFFHTRLFQILYHCLHASLFSEFYCKSFLLIRESDRYYYILYYGYVLSIIPDHDDLISIRLELDRLV